MEPAAGEPDPITRLALEKLSDIVDPPPVSWIPQTWGWGLLVATVVALVAIALARWRGRHKANRYRREALAQLGIIEKKLGDPSTRPEALAAIPDLLKRVALAAWPRNEVASLCGEQWLAFLRRHGDTQSLSEAVIRLLGDLEYRSISTLASISEGEARLCSSFARLWIEKHRVSA